MNNKEDAIRELKELLEKLESHGTVGFDIEGSEEVVIKDYRSRGYSKAGKIKDVNRVHLEKQDHEAPKQTDLAY